MFERQRLGEILVAQGALSAAELERYLGEQAQKGMRIGEYLVSENAISPLELSKALATQADVDFAEEIDLDALDLDLLDHLPINFARARKMLPLWRTEYGVEVAVIDPFDIVGIDQVAQTLGHRVDPIIVSPTLLTDSLNVAYDRHDRLKGRYGAMLEDEQKESDGDGRSAEHTSELQSRGHLVCR